MRPCVSRGNLDKSSAFDRSYDKVSIYYSGYLDYTLANVLDKVINVLALRGEGFRYKSRAQARVGPHTVCPTYMN